MPGLALLFAHLSWFAIFLVTGIVGLVAVRPAAWIRWGVAVVIAAFFLAGWVARMQVLADHREYWQKACYASQRIILGAIEMYNADAGTATPQIGFRGQPVPYEALEAGGHLKGTATCGHNDYLKGGIPPGTYSLQPLPGSTDPTDGRVVCSLHGAVDD